MLKQSASAETVEVKMRTSDLRSTLTLTSAYLLDAALLGTATGDHSRDSRSSCRRLAWDEINEMGLFHLGEIGNDSRVMSVLKIHDEHGRRSRIECFIGKQCSKT